MTVYHRPYECPVGTKTFQENHDTNKSAYSIGNITFTNIMPFNLSFTKYFLLYYSFGDNTSDTVRIENRTRSTNYTHNYTNVCDKCNYGVTLISVLLFDYTYYCKFDGVISVISKFKRVMYANMYILNFLCFRACYTK